jgi:hypothetical protein
MYGSSNMLGISFIGILLLYIVIYNLGTFINRKQLLLVFLLTGFLIIASGSRSSMILILSNYVLDIKHR